MKCSQPLRGARGVVIDTNILIYLFEDHPRYAEAAEFIIDAAASGMFSGVVTPVTVAELLVKPLQADRPDIADRYRTALRHMQNVISGTLDAEIGAMAAALRAKYGLPLPDMFQAAVALRSPTPIIITNDKAISRVTELTAVSLDDCLV